jgi:hypothetical protein
MDISHAQAHPRGVSHLGVEGGEGSSGGDEEIGLGVEKVPHIRAELLLRCPSPLAVGLFQREAHGRVPHDLGFHISLGRLGLPEVVLHDR